MKEPDDTERKNGHLQCLTEEPPPAFLPDSTPEVRRSVYRLCEEARLELEETERFVQDVAGRRGLFGISTST